METPFLCVDFRNDPCCDRKWSRWVGRWLPDRSVKTARSSAGRNAAKFRHGKPGCLYAATHDGCADVHFVLHAHCGKNDCWTNARSTALFPAVSHVSPGSKTLLWVCNHLFVSVALQFGEIGCLYPRWKQFCLTLSHRTAVRSRITACTVVQAVV